jgi:hypothetical protein
LGAILLAAAFVRSEQKPLLPSIMLAYGLFLPLNAGGLGWGLGKAPLWPDGVLVFLTHLALSVVAGCITLAVMRFKPARVFGYLLPVLLVVASLAGLVYLTGLVDSLRQGITNSRITVPTVAPPTRTAVIPTLTPTRTRTPVASATPLPTNTASPTETPVPTQAYAVITAASDFGGANLRSEPGGGYVLTVLSNGIIVLVFPEIATAQDGTTWQHVRWNDLDGWALTTVLTATTQTPPTPPTPTLLPQGT